MFEVTIYWKVDGSTRTFNYNTVTEDEAIEDLERIFGKHETLIKQVRFLKAAYEKGMA